MEKSLKLCNLPVVTREDSRFIQLASNGGYWPKCDSPLVNPNILIGDSCDIHLGNHVMMYFYRQCSNDECLIIDFYGIYYCSFIIVDYVFANEMNSSAAEYLDMILSNFPFSALFEFIFFQFFFLPIPNFGSYCFPATLIPNTPNLVVRITLSLSPCFELLF